MQANPNDMFTFDNSLGGGGGSGLPGTGLTTNLGGDNVSKDMFDPGSKNLNLPPGNLDAPPLNPDVGLGVSFDPGGQPIDFGGVGSGTQLGTGTGTSTVPGAGTGVTNPPVTTGGVGSGTGSGAGITTNFPANTGGVGSTLTTTGGNVSNLNPGTLMGFNTGDPSVIVKQLDSLFGQGMGSILYQFLSTGAGYNPNVSTALANANLPYEERSRNNILESFGASGGRYSSPAAIGLGDFESSYALGQQGIFANEYDKAVQRYTDIFSGILDTAHAEQANKFGLPQIINLITSVLPTLGIPGLGGQQPGNKPTDRPTWPPPYDPKPKMPKDKPIEKPTNTDTGVKNDSSGLGNHAGWLQDENGLWWNPYNPDGSLNWNSIVTNLPLDNPSKTSGGLGQSPNWGITVNPTNDPTGGVGDINWSDPSTWGLSPGGDNSWIWDENFDPGGG